MSPWLLKTNNTTLLCIFRILNPAVDRHSCLKVLATASIFNTRLVKNFAARIKSDEREEFFKVILEPSLSSRLKLFHDLVISSIEKTGTSNDHNTNEKRGKNTRKRKENHCIPHPQRNEKPLAQEISLLSLEDTHTF